MDAAGRTGLVGLVTHADCLRHSTGAGHPERPVRLTAVLEQLAASGVADELERVDAAAAADADLLRVHPEDHVRRIDAAGARGPENLDADTAVSEGSARAARLAAGGIVAAALRVWSGAWSSAFVAVRPPGHHAEARRAMGFCLFNGVAVAARAAQAAGAERVAILDWDVHHGNGTQHVFEDDPTVYYASLHQWPLYPGTGAADERGVGAGAGATLNLPMPAGSGDREWLGALEREVLPELERFRPELVLISAGFDAHRLDPLAACTLTEAGYGALTRLVAAFVAERCGGRVVSALEGGYHLGALAASARAHVEALVEAAR